MSWNRFSPGLALAVWLFTGCAQDTLVGLSTTTDEFAQSAASAIDVLWVVDNSESMVDEQAGLGESFDRFISGLVATEVDYHIGVISTDASEGGILHAGDAGVGLIDTTTVQPQVVFAQNVKVGTSGSRNEEAFQSAALALGQGLGWTSGTSPTPPNDGFLRQDAALFIIMVSDEDDKSLGSVGYYRRLFESYKGPGNEALISISAIVGAPGQGGGCQADNGQVAAPGDRFFALAMATGGIWTSVCGEFASSLEQLSLTATGLDSVFALTRRPNPAAVIEGCGEAAATGFCVRIIDDGGTESVVLADDGATWTYDDGLGEHGAILFAADALPPPRSTVTVEYRGAPR